MGVVGLVLPSNDPLALPVGKLAPALVFGNAAVVKPAPEAGAAARRCSICCRAGARAGAGPPGAGGAEGGEAVVADAVDGVAVTGSVATGRTVIALCAAHRTPLQAEFGGNNAAMVLADVDLHVVVPSLVHGVSRSEVSAAPRFGA